MVLKIRRHKRQLKKEGATFVKDARKLVREVNRLNRKDTNNIMKTLHNHMLLVAEMNALIAGHMERIHSTEKADYLVSSLFLKESFELLNQREVESLHFVTGPEIEGTKVLDKIVDFRLEKQSAVYAKADTASVREALIYLSRHEFKLWGCFHIHPGSGAYSTFPSGTDMTLDGLLNNGGYECIGAIFSRDGYVRFFSSKEFEIKIYGNGVERVNEKLYRLAKVD